MLTVAGGTVRGQARHGLRRDESWVEVADDRAIQDAYRNGARTITPDIARTFVEHLTADHEDEDTFRDAHVRVAALAMLPQTRPALDAEADKIAQDWLTGTESRSRVFPRRVTSLYAKITAMSTDPD